MTPGPHTLTVGELAGMLAGLDPAAYTDVVGICRDAGAIVQYKLAPNPKSLLEEEQDRYEELRAQTRSTEHKLEQLRTYQRAEAKRLGLATKTLRGLALLRAAGVPRLP